MDPQSVYYIKRFSDTIALNTIADQGVTIVIKGPRQVGKSSLLAQVIKAAAEAGKQTVPLDFQLFDRSALTDSATFFRQFCTWIIRRLRIGNQINEYQDADGLGNVLCCTFYMEDLLEKLGRPLLLAMDEVERIFDSDFRSDFFSMLRSWHDSRADTPMKQLDLVLVTSTEPYLFIEQLDQSPFNVGEIIYLEDFKLQAVDDLNRRHGSPLTQDQVRQLIELVGGHPYLVRRALYLLASGRTSVDKLFQSATADRGPFGDHLRRYLFRLYGREDVVQGLKEVIRSKTCQDDIVIHRLEGAGLVRREGQFVVPRCQLYARYFGERLHA